MDTVKLWCVRCMCGQSWIMQNTKVVICTCGAKLVRKSSSCKAEVPDDYNLNSKPYHQPAIYQQEFPVRS